MSTSSNGRRGRTSLPFGRLFDACYQPLVACARRRTSLAAADDVVAETLAIAWRRLDDVPADAELPWLYGNARRVVANQRRSDDRRLRLIERVANEWRMSGRSVLAADRASSVAVALSRLRLEDQEVLRLAAWEQLTSAEIAVALGCTPNAAALRLSRARAAVRRRLTEIESCRTPLAGRCRSPEHHDELDRLSQIDPARQVPCLPQQTYRLAPCSRGSR